MENQTTSGTGNARTWHWHSSGLKCDQSFSTLHMPQRQLMRLRQLRPVLSLHGALSRVSGSLVDDSCIAPSGRVARQKHSGLWASILTQGAQKPETLSTLPHQPDSTSDVRLSLCCNLRPVTTPSHKGRVFCAGACAAAAPGLCQHIRGSQKAASSAAAAAWPRPGGQPAPPAISWC